MKQLEIFQILFFKILKNIIELKIILSAQVSIQEASGLIDDVVIWLNVECIIGEVIDVLHFFFDDKGHVAERKHDILS